MLIGQLPLEIDPFKLADQEVTLQGELPIACFSRLAKLLDNPEGVTKVTLIFKRDEHGIRTIQGEITATLQLVCQRCGEAVSCDINAKPCLSPVVHDSQVVSLAKEFDPLVTGGEPVMLMDLIEEELLLSLPMFPKHEPAECALDLTQYK